MSELYLKSQIKLELNQVLEQLAECAGSHEGKKACMSITPSSDLDEVQSRLDETTAASVLSTNKGYPVFSDIRDVSASVDRAERGGRKRGIFRLWKREVILTARIDSDGVGLVGCRGVHSGAGGKRAHLLLGEKLG